MSNPTLTLTAGQSYTMSFSNFGHPFWIKTVQGNGNADGYSAFTSNAIESGSATFAVPIGAPSVLYYNCEYHGIMTGIINVVAG
jgi:hypothetical protein